jgi:hypothetical protein
MPAPFGSVWTAQITPSQATPTPSKSESGTPLEQAAQL